MKGYNIQKADALIDVFKDFSAINNDSKRTYVLLKTQRLFTVIQIVADSIKDNTSLQDRVRHLSLSLFDNFTSVIFVGGGEGESETRSAHVAQLAGLLELAATLGHVSQESSSLIIRELFTVHDLVGSARVVVPEGERWATANLFDVPVPSYKGQNAAYRRKDKGRGGSIASVTSGRRYIKDNKGHPIKDSRDDAVLSLLKQHDNLTVTDFVSVMPDVSEKTIQRQLLRMVGEGRLVKVGSRRWTRYSVRR